MGFSYDDTQLWEMLELLDMKKRKEAFACACRKTGGKVRKVARNNLRGSALRNAAKMQRQVRLISRRKDVGFRVTVSSNSSRKRGMYINHFGLEKPVPRWAETGTKERTAGPRLRGIKKRKVSRSVERYRGRMPKFGFMEMTERQVQSWIAEDFRDELVKAVFRIANKHGVS